MVFAAVHEPAPGPNRQFAARQHDERNRGEADGSIGGPSRGEAKTKDLLPVRGVIHVRAALKKVPEFRTPEA
jgi:hypothetical protein